MIARAVDDAVPAAFASLYARLEAALTAFVPPAPPVPTPDGPAACRFTGDLFLANSNRADALPDAGSPFDRERVTRCLEALVALGAGAITLSVHEYVLARSPLRERHLAFYRWLVGEVRARGLPLLIESGHTLTVPPPDTFAEYVQARETALRLILTDLSPDYLAITGELETEALATGYAELRTAADRLVYVQQLLDALDDVRGDTPVGPVVSGWAPRSEAQALLTLDGVDLIDFHVYPILPAFLDRLVEYAAIARDAGKVPLIGEAWLYKATAAETLTVPATALYARDVYAFWSPLDQAFLGQIAAIGRALGMPVVTAFWSQYFWASLPWDDSVPVLPYSAGQWQVQRAALAAMRTGETTPTGEAFRQIAASVASQPEGTP
jgi:hypothetical protein